MQENMIATPTKSNDWDGTNENVFTSPDKIEVTHFAPSAELAPYVTQIYFFRCEEQTIRDRQPASLGHLIFLLSGKGTLQFKNGDIANVSGAALFGPGMAAAEFTFEGPLYDLGFALSPLGFVALTGKPANLYADRAVSASELFGPEIDRLAESFIAGHANGSMRVAEMVEKVSALLLSNVKRVPQSHVEMVHIVINWLSRDLDPNVENLYPKLDMSRSTAARLITRYFGSAPKQLMRKYRQELHRRIEIPDRVAVL
jgi:AraC-like DNA-binding protein